jgi:acetyl esterase/lipase
MLSGLAHTRLKVAIDYARSVWRIIHGVQVLGDFARMLRRPKIKPSFSSTLLVIRLARGTRFTRAPPGRASLPANLPLVLIFHDRADTLVPLDESQRFQAATQKLDSQVELVVHHGGRHGWWSMIRDIWQFADWFDQHLRQ